MSPEEGNELVNPGEGRYMGTVSPKRVRQDRRTILQSRRKEERRRARRKSRVEFYGRSTLRDDWWESVHGTMTESTLELDEKTSSVVNMETGTLGV